MVLSKLTLINNYVKLHRLLGASNTLNTNDSQIKCNKVKDITMNYQQETKNSRMIKFKSMKMYGFVWNP